MPITKEYKSTAQEIDLLEDGQINIYGEEEPDVVEKSVWDKSVKVEENGYYWHKESNRG